MNPEYWRSRRAGFEAAAQRLHVHQWACKYRVNSSFAIVAQRAALWSPRLFEIGQLMRRRGLDETFRGHPNHKSWLRLYTQHGRLYRVVEGLAPERLARVVVPIEVAGHVRALKQFRKEHPDVWKKELDSVDPLRFRRYLQQSARRAWRDYRHHLRMIVAELTDQEDDGWDVEQLELVPEIEFFCNVWLRCALEYETVPVELLRGIPIDCGQAMGAEADAIATRVEKLVRIDAAAADLRRVKRWKNDGSRAVRRTRQELVGRWMQEGPNGQFTCLGIYQSLAGFLSVLSDQLNFRCKSDGTLQQRRVSPRQLLELFDAGRKDRKQNELNAADDSGLADVNPEAWEKAVHRQRKVWGVVFRTVPDKSQAE